MQCQLCGETDKYISPQIYGFITDESKNPQITSPSCLMFSRVILCDSCINGIAVHSNIFRNLEGKVTALKNAIRDLTI